MDVLLSLITVWLASGLAGTIYVIDKEVSRKEWNLFEDSEPYGMMLTGLVLGPFVFVCRWEDFTP